MSAGIFCAAFLLQAHADQSASQPSSPSSSASLPGVLRENQPSMLPSSGNGDEPGSGEVTPLSKEQQQPLPQDHDPNWLLKGVQAEQKAAARTEAASTNPPSFNSQFSSNALVDPLHPASTSLSPPSSTPSSRYGTSTNGNDFKPLLIGISSDTSKPLQQTAQAKPLNNGKTMPALSSINPDLIKPVDLNEINPDVAPPAFAGPAALTSTAIKVPGGFDGTGMPTTVTPAPSAFAPAAPVAPAIPTPKALPVPGDWKPAAIPPAPKPVLAPSITAPVAPAAPSLPSAPRLPDPNNETPFH